MAGRKKFTSKRAIAAAVAAAVRTERERVKQAAVVTAAGQVAETASERLAHCWMLQQEFLTVIDVAKECGVSEPTVRAWDKQGKLPAIRTRSGVRLFQRTAVEQIKAQRAEDVVRSKQIDARN